MQVTNTISSTENIAIVPTNRTEQAQSRGILTIKRLIWIYFLLLIFEGALRKWVLPGLATPLLVVRDPFALLILINASRQGLLPFNKYAYGMIAIGCIALFTAIFLGHGNLFVAIYGARILILHFPLIFIIGTVFNRRDVLNIGKALVYITPLMTILVALQFYSPQSAWVNRGIGGSLEGGGFSGALGFFRPPATFSFTNGTALFFGMVAPYIFYFWFHPKEIPRWVLIAASISLLASIPLSISRSLFFSVVVVMSFTVIASLRRPKYLGMISFILFGIVIVFLLLSKTQFFHTATEAFSSRFESANKTEGGLKGVIGDRYLGGMIGALTENSTKLPFWGYGIGMGTNVGSMLLTGKTKFLISEGEWGRLIGEMGILLGFLTILIRLILTARLFFYSYKKLSLGDLLPWFLLSFAALQIPQGQWAQPTSLGFGILSAGLVLASLKGSDLTNNKTDRPGNPA